MGLLLYSLGKNLESAQKIPPVGRIRELANKDAARVEYELSSARKFSKGYRLYESYLQNRK